MLIDMEIPSDRDTSVNLAEKLSKYKNLEIDITKMWGLKTITVPVVINRGTWNSQERHRKTH